MPTSSSSSIHLSCQSSRRSKAVPVSSVEEQPSQKPVETTCYPNNMKPQEELKKVSNGSLAKKEQVVRYRECRKNHAANIGGYALDGCREFMASGEEGTTAALRCAACSCHRSFHKREVESDTFCDCSSDSTTRS